ncbi:hypothetical protein DS909_06670 [Phaeobacter gallaeciensis]|uniref:DUF1376 domain-containing protein n=1 Tax=Phaeobacter gallaeciensis TaxID=60890 RepID=A0A366X702_9RHOB|nr:hypothetical protein [Phaeobacter gallaeciensis]RBW58426.1 hypothetical protein DS909_06670 [Phaeobacter gallaeciensis]
MDAEPDRWPLRVGETLSSHDWFPFYGHKFLSSSFLRRAVKQDRREDVGTALILWAEAMREDPAGTLPTNDIDLADIARFATVEEWLAVKENVLHGWVPVLVEDGRSGGTIERLGHSALIEEIVQDMYKRKRGRDAARDAGRHALKKHKIRKKMTEMGVEAHIIENDRAILALAEHFEHSELYITPDNVRAAMAEVLEYTGQVTPISSVKRN